MALFVKQNENQTEYQKKIAAELQERARKKAEGELPDGVDDSAFIKGTKQTTGLAGVWIAIIVLAIVATIWIIVASVQQ